MPSHSVPNGNQRRASQVSAPTANAVPRPLPPGPTGPSSTWNHHHSSFAPKTCDMRERGLTKTQAMPSGVALAAGSVPIGCRTDDGDGLCGSSRSVLERDRRGEPIAWGLAWGEGRGADRMHAQHQRCGRLPSLRLRLGRKCDPPTSHSSAYPDERMVSRARARADGMRSDHRMANRA